jgi:hypothetical protein
MKKEKIKKEREESGSKDKKIKIDVGGVIIGVVIEVIVGYIIFRRRAAKRNDNK